MIEYELIQNKSIGDLIDLLAGIKAERKKLEEQDAELSKDVQVVSARLRELMVEAGTNSASSDTATATLALKVRAGIEHHAQFFTWLVENKEEAIAKLAVGPDFIDEAMLKKIKVAGPEDIKVVIAWNRLDSYVKSLEKDGKLDFINADTWPAGLKITETPDIKIKLKK